MIDIDDMIDKAYITATGVIVGLIIMLVGIYVVKENVVDNSVVGPDKVEDVIDMKREYLGLDVSGIDGGLTYNEYVNIKNEFNRYKYELKISELRGMR